MSFNKNQFQLLLDFYMNKWIIMLNMFYKTSILINVNKLIIKPSYVRSVYHEARNWDTTRKSVFFNKSTLNPLILVTFFNMHEQATGWHHQIFYNNWIEMHMIMEYRLKCMFWLSAWTLCCVISVASQCSDNSRFAYKVLLDSF